MWPNNSSQVTDFTSIELLKLFLLHSSPEVKLNFSSSVGIPLDSVILIIQLIKKQGLSQVKITCTA